MFQTWVPNNIKRHILCSITWFRTPCRLSSWPAFQTLHSYNLWALCMTLKRPERPSAGPRGRSWAGYKYKRRARAFRAVPGHTHRQTNYSTRHYGRHISLMDQLGTGARPVAERRKCPISEPNHSTTRIIYCGLL
jgi:hypothetical protein